MSEAIQMSFYAPETTWQLPDMAKLPDFSQAKRIAIDCETYDPDLKELGPGDKRNGETIGWAVAIEDGPKFYLPIRHRHGENLPLEQVLQYLANNFKNFQGEIVGANITYDINYAIADGIKFHPNVMFRDIQVNDPLINENHFSYSLNAIGERWGVKGKDEDMLLNAARSMGLDPKQDMYKIPPEYVGEYAENDVASPLLILREQEKSIKQKGLERVYQLESELIPVIVRMRQRGIRIDEEKLDSIGKWALQLEQEKSNFIKEETGLRIDVGDFKKPSKVEPVLRKVGLVLDKTATGLPKIDAEVLQKSEKPVVKAILTARKANTLQNTFVKSIKQHVVNGRIHCEFHQIAKETEGGKHGVRYGRMSASNPNMQQQPNPDRDPEIAGEWRKIYIPEEGAIWGCNDYSQQEPRWTTHFASVMKLERAEEVLQKYINDPSTDNHEMMTRLVYGNEQVDEWKKSNPREFKLHRTRVKDTFLGLCYGEGDAKMCEDFGLPTTWRHMINWKTGECFDGTKEDCLENKRKMGGYGNVYRTAGHLGRQILDKFDTEVPFIRQLSKAAKNRVKEVGYVKTIMGRRCNFVPQKDAGFGTYQGEHKALNRIIQGSSADQAKQALIEADRAGYFIQLPVHDEIDGSYGSVEEAKKVAEIMRDCVHNFADNVTIPFKVDTECGPNWGEIKEV